ncbi:MAG: hypothetical protein KA146_02210 [Leptospiraceae bacterium]|nr:hypothetical protein [Leptospiraceae bacterium]
MTKSIEEQAKKYAAMAYASPKEKVIAMIAYDHGANWAAKARDVQWSAVVNELREALKHTNEFCLCKRNTYGFDYHEDHPVMGKPKSGSRWLTPRDYNKDALTKADQLLREMRIK